MDFATTDPDQIAEAIVAEAGREVSYRPVETDGAARATAVIADLLRGGAAQLRKRPIARLGRFG